VKSAVALLLLVFVVLVVRDGSVLRIMQTVFAKSYTVGSLKSMHRKQILNVKKMSS